MKRHFRNIILIGMAGAGKSTIGPLLAAQTGCTYVDTDQLIARDQGRPIQEVLDRLGPAGFSRLEDRILLSLQLRDHVIATGGSAVYCRAGMRHLQATGIVVLLEAELDTLRQRVNNPDSRGLVNPAGESFARLYRNRLPLYRHYADLTVATSGVGPEEVCREILAGLSRVFPHGQQWT